MRGGGRCGSVWGGGVAKGLRGDGGGGESEGGHNDTLSPSEQTAFRRTEV